MRCWSNRAMAEAKGLQIESSGGRRDGDIVVGIDLGTTNSLVAYMQGDIPSVIPGEDGLNLVPSIVALKPDDQFAVGTAAYKYLIETPERAVYSIKRLMGRGTEDVQEELKFFPFRLAEDSASVLKIR